jgi:hypothetical protein
MFSFISPRLRYYILSDFAVNNYQTGKFLPNLNKKRGEIESPRFFCTAKLSYAETGKSSI